MSNAKPNFFILGVAKSGTTTLADSLRQHPDIFIPAVKEPTFFSSDINYSNGINWYIDNYFSNSVKYHYRGDASPSYIFFAEKVARRIQTDLSAETIKFIVIFRNPVDRAYSHYWHNVNRGLQENLTFEEALQAEEGRLKSQSSELNDLGRIRYAYFNAGLYTNQLREFWKRFPRENFLLLLSEDLHQQNFVQTMDSVQTFLQLPRIRIEYGHSNASYRPTSRAFEKTIRRQSIIKSILKLIIPAKTRVHLKSSLLKMNASPVAYPPMNPATREGLVKKYTPQIQELETIINRDLSTWRR